MADTQLTPEQKQVTTQRAAAAKQKAKRSARIRLIVFLVSLGVFLYFSYSFVNSFSGPQANPSSAPIVVSAAELSQAYSNNEVSADQAYKNQLLEVNGPIGTIGKDIFGNPYVTLVDANGLQEAQCGFSQSDEDALANLVAGEPITLEGTGDGAALGTPELTHCSIVPNASSTQ